jgi:hypothetical protein
MWNNLQAHHHFWPKPNSYLATDHTSCLVQLPQTDPVLSVQVCVRHVDQLRAVKEVKPLAAWTHQPESEKP